jgi:hypothetical protein
MPPPDPTSATDLASSRHPNGPQPQITLLHPSPATPQDGTLSHYNRGSLLLATANQPIAKIVSPPRAPGDPEPTGPPDATALLGTNVRLDHDGVTIFATVHGQIRLTPAGISVEEGLEVRGDVDFSTGNIQFGGDLHIRGSVRDGFVIRAAGAVLVEGVIEGAAVHAGTQITARGGINGGQKAHIVSDGTIAARVIDHATVEAQGDITVDREITHSHITCAGHLVMPHGTLVAGEVAARAGVTCYDLGSPLGVPVMVEVGMDRGLLRLALEKVPQAETHLARARKVRDVLKPLLATRRLTASQKEKATELLFEADELEGQARVAIEELRLAFAAWQARPATELTVGHLLHTGAVIRFPGVQTHIQSDLHGPLRITLDHTAGFAQIVAHRPGEPTPEPGTPAGRVLPTEPYTDEILTRLRHLLNDGSPGIAPAAAPVYAPTAAIPAPPHDTTAATQR